MTAEVESHEEICIRVGPRPWDSSSDYPCETPAFGHPGKAAHVPLALPLRDVTVPHASSDHASVTRERLARRIPNRRSVTR